MLPLLLLDPLSIAAGLGIFIASSVRRPCDKCGRNKLVKYFPLLSPVDPTDFRRYTFCVVCVRPLVWKYKKWRRILANRRKRPSYKAAAAMKRKAQKLHATPTWADETAIDAFYAEADRLTCEMGVKHQVDHILPLQGETVCGLHVPANLRVIPAIENLRKSNRILDDFT